MAEQRSGVRLRTHQPGDLGWIVHRHGELYAREHGFPAAFESLVAGIAADFLGGHDPARERCWIAELTGRRVGSVMVVDAGGNTAKLRLLLVEPEARGQGVGRRLIDECVTFSREAGYDRLILWTNQVLAAARHLYESSGFRCVAEETDDRFGEHNVGEHWELCLRD